MVKRSRYLGALLALLPVAAPAADEVGHWYVDPYIGGIKPDHDWGAPSSNAFDYGIAFGKHLSQHLSAEIDLNGARLHEYDGSPPFNTGHAKLYAGSLNLLGVFSRGSTVAPYISIGAGATHWDPDVNTLDTRTRFMAQAGVGAFIKLWENADASRSFSLRPDVKGRWTDVHDNPVDLLYVLGFTFSWGPGVSPPVATAVAPPPPAAPLPTPPPPQAKCPGVPSGVMVDKDGCPIADVVLLGVNFATDSSTLTAQSKPVLDEVAKGLIAHPRLKIEIQGHTDSTGSATHNLGLSQRRAEAVRDYLISQNVPAGQLMTKGYGQTQPVQSNATPQGRLQNRRVVMHVLENPGDIPVKDAGKALEAQ